MFYYKELRIPCLSQLYVLTHVGVCVSYTGCTHIKILSACDKCREASQCTGELQLWQLYISLSCLCFCECIHCSFILVWEGID